MLCGRTQFGGGEEHGFQDVLRFPEQDLELIFFTDICRLKAANQFPLTLKSSFKNENRYRDKLGSSLLIG